MLTRRTFLKTSGLAVVAASFGGIPTFLTKTAAATRNFSNTRKKILVTIFQRGAMDGLMAVPLFNDPMYVKLRSGLAMSAIKSSDDSQLIDLDGRYGLHPALTPFGKLYKESRLAIVHGVGSPDRTRSHFDAQDYMESGTPGIKSTSSGWLNRACGLLGHDASNSNRVTPFQALSATQSLPRSLYGKEPAIAVSNINELGLDNFEGKENPVNLEKGFESLYKDASQPFLNNTSKESFEAIQLLKKMDLKNYQPSQGAVYPNTQFGKSMQQIAQLIKADVGMEIAFAEISGWDNHVSEGTTHGVFARAADDLSKSIYAFWTDIGTCQDDVTLMTMTEFGRTVRENGSGGTDHGRASCLFVLGNDVQGGKVYGTVTSLDPDALEDNRDLPVTTDFRAVFSEVAGRHLNLNNDAALFPAWNGDRLLFMKA